MSFWKRAWLRKPLDVVFAEERHEALDRNMTIWDLLAIGIGGTIGSGIFVLSGLISSDYAGPGGILSWAISGIGCIFSGLSYAEMSSRIPSAGSSYSYAYFAVGEMPAFVAFWCLSLEYAIGGAAVARSWGEKFIIWWKGIGGTMPESLDATENGPNLFAALMVIACTAVLIGGVSLGKKTVNFFTILKLSIVAFMTISGFILFKSENLQPFMPYGFSGVMRGATSAFFGYIGYDEVCCLAAEAKNPRRTVPLAVGGSILGLMIVYVLAALALSGMQYYKDIDTDSGFSEALKDHKGWIWAGQLVAAGELVSLPLVVLVSLLAQPRLQYAMARDGLMPQIFAQVDSKGNLMKNIIITGFFCTLIASFVSFTYLNDMISAGILLSFNLTNSGLIIIRRGGSYSSAQDHGDADTVSLLQANNAGSDNNANNNPKRQLIVNLVTAFNVLALVTAALWVVVGDEKLDIPVLIAAILATLACAGFAYYIDKKCPEYEPKTEIDPSETFKAPWIPYMPCIGIVLNYLFVVQLTWLGLLLIGAYIGMSILVYFLYGVRNSVGNRDGWRQLLERPSVGNKNVVGSNGSTRDSASELVGEKHASKRSSSRSRSVDYPLIAAFDDSAKLLLEEDVDEQSQQKGYVPPSGPTDKI